MIHSKNSKIMMIMLIALLTSCSVTKMRYTKGFNVDFFSRKDKSIEPTKKALVATKKAPSSMATIEEITSNSDVLNPTSNPKINNSQVAISKMVMPKKSINQTSKFWNKLYVQVDKIESRISKSKPKSKTNLNSSTSTNGDGSSGVWGILGFIFGLIGVWPLAIGFSIVGMGRNRNSRGLAITGLVLGIIWMIISLAIVSA